MMASVLSSFALLFCLVGVVLGHGWMTSPVPRDGPNTNTNSPCENSPPTNPPNTQVFRGVPFTVSWITPHKPGGSVVLAYAPMAQTPSADSFKQLTTVGYDSGSTSVIIPEDTDIGMYTFQWYQTSPGPYWNCAEVMVYAAPPKGATLESGTTYRLSNGHGTFDAATGKIHCDSGYHKSGSSCTKKLSGGAAFGIFLLVLVLVALIGSTAVMIFLKLKHPDKYEHVMGKFKSAGSSAKHKMSNLTNRGGNSGQYGSNANTHV